jgi:hypothetical protein
VARSFAFKRHGTEPQHLAVLVAEDITSRFLSDRETRAPRAPSTALATAAHTGAAVAHPGID